MDLEFKRAALVVRPRDRSRRSTDQLAWRESRPSPELAAIDRALKKPFREFRDDVEREYVHRLVRLHGGNASAAAQAAGIDRTYIYRLIRKHER